MSKAARLPFLIAAAAVAGFSFWPAETVVRGRPAQNQDVRKIYRIVGSLSRSEIDRNFLENIDSLIPPFPSGSRYQIGDIPAVAGRLSVHKFEALYRGESAEGEKEFHDLLVLETDSAGTIIDGYQYTLEWTDIPTLDLFRVGAAGVLLRDGLMIQELKLANVRTGARLEESGVIAFEK